MQKNFFEKCLFAYEIRFAVEKKFGPNFQNNLKNFLCRHQKNASHTISIYGNCMIGIFPHTKNFDFFLLNLVSEKFSVVFATEQMWERHWLLKIPKVGRSCFFNA